MLQFLQPIWLTAMAGIVFPVLLHLWNDRQGKLLAVGSVALLEKQLPKQTWSRRLSEWWLLVLRCLLLMALALLLAGPSWRRGAAGDGKKGWVLEMGVGAGRDGGVGAGAEEVGRQYKPLIDSLLKAGYERRAWTEGENYWDVFRAADRVAPVGIPFYIFSPGWANGFVGSRPSTDRPVHWYLYTPTDSVSHWIGGTWLSAGDSVRVAEGSSRPTGTSYSYRMAPAGSVKVDSAVLRITIYTDADHVQDGRYLAAAVRSVEQFERRRIQLVVTGSIPGQGAVRPDWLFWLSPRPVPEGVMADHILQYEPGRAVAVDTWMRGVEDVEIRKEVEMVGAAAAVWKDGYGRALLDLERTGHGAVYHFFSRFDPEWNGLVWSRQWPVMIERLMFGSGDRWSGRDRRVLDPKQVAPARRDKDGVHGGGVAMNAGMVELLDLAPVCWMLIVLLFISERIVAYGGGGRKK